MANKTIKIGDKTFEAKYTFGAFHQMHKKHGVNVFDLPDATPHLIAVLIWGAIIHADPLADPEKITEVISMEDAMNGNRTCIALIMATVEKAKSDNAAKSEDAT